MPPGAPRARSAPSRPRSARAVSIGSTRCTRPRSRRAPLRAAVGGSGRGPRRSAIGACGVAPRRRAASTARARRGSGGRRSQAPARALGDRRDAVLAGPTVPAARSRRRRAATGSLAGRGEVRVSGARGRLLGAGGRVPCTLRPARPSRGAAPVIHPSEPGDGARSPRRSITPRSTAAGYGPVECPTRGVRTSPPAGRRRARGQPRRAPMPSSRPRAPRALDRHPVRRVLDRAVGPRARLRRHRRGRPRRDVYAVRAPSGTPQAGDELAGTLSSSPTGIEQPRRGSLADGGAPGADAISRRGDHPLPARLAEPAGGCSVGLTWFPGVEQGPRRARRRAQNRRSRPRA